MERRLRIFEMDETADPVALAHSRMVHDRLPPEYADTRARRAIDLKAVKNSNDDLSSFVMLPDGPLVSGLFPFFFHSFAMSRRDSDVSSSLAEGGRERCTVRPTHSLSPSVRVHGTTAETGAGGTEGAGDPAPGAPGAERRRVPAA
jgi:hypothetical protein